VPWDEPATVQLLHGCDRPAAAWALAGVVTRRQQPRRSGNCRGDLGTAARSWLLRLVVLVSPAQSLPGDAFPSPTTAWAAAVRRRPRLGRRWALTSRRRIGPTRPPRRRLMPPAFLDSFVLLACDLAASPGLGVPKPLPRWAPVPWPCRPGRRAERSGLDRWVGPRLQAGGGPRLKAAVFRTATTGPSPPHRSSQPSLGWLALRRRRDDVAVVSRFGVQSGRVAGRLGCPPRQVFGNWLVPFLPANAVTKRFPPARSAWVVATARACVPPVALFITHRPERLLWRRDPRQAAGQAEVFPYRRPPFPFPRRANPSAGAFTRSCIALPCPTLLVHPGRIHDRWVFQVGSPGCWAAPDGSRGDAPARPPVGGPRPA